MAGLGFGEALGVGAVFVLVFGLALIGLLVMLSVTAVLYGLSVDAGATLSGIGIAIMAALVIDLAGGPANLVVAALPVGFFGATGLLYRSRTGRERRRLFQSGAGRRVVSGCGFLTLASAATIWLILFLFFRFGLVSLLFEEPATVIQLLVLTGLAVAVGTQALWETMFTPG